MDETQGVVRSSDEAGTINKPSRPVRPVLELAFCVVGSLLTVDFPSIGVAIMVFGAWLLARKEEGRALWAVAGCLAPGIVLSLASWDLGSLVLPCVAAALAIALLLPGRISITTVCAVIVGLTALMVAADASLLMLWGEDFAAYVQALLDEIRELVTASLTTGASSVAVKAAVDSTVELLGKTWPLLYASRAAVATVAGLFGLMLARRDTYQRVYRAFTRYDMPLWGVVVLVGALAAFLAEALLPECPVAVETAGLNLLLVMRVLFFIQGLAVGMEVMDARKWGPVPRVLTISCMLLAELGLCAVTVFGVIDVWANFRRLDRSDGLRPELHGEGE